MLLTYQMRCFCLVGDGLLRGAQREDRNEAAVTYPPVLSELPKSSTWMHRLFHYKLETKFREKTLQAEHAVNLHFNLKGNLASFWKCHVLQPRAGDTCLHTVFLGGPEARPAVLSGESSFDVKLELSVFPWLSGLIADTRSTLK